MKYENEELMDDLDMGNDVEDCEEDDDLDFIDLSEFMPVKSTSKAKASTEAGVITIINSKKNGKRIILAKELVQKIKANGAINIVLANDAIVIASADAAIGNEFPFKVSGNKVIIYATDLINEITDHYDLDFSNCVSKTFHRVKYSKTLTHKVAMITVE